MNFIVEGYPAFAYTGGRTFDRERPALVFIHGAAFDHSVWQWQSRYFAHHGFAVIAVDLPAHGRSPGSARTAIEALGHWTVGLLDAAGIRQAAFVGHSMGALAALETALKHPARVAKLALLGTAVPMPVGDAFLAAARDDSPAALDMEAVWGHARLGALVQSGVPGTALLPASRRLNARARNGVLAADLGACNAYRVDDGALAKLSVPTLVVAGKRDQMTPLKAGQALAARIPGAKLVTIDAGHAMTVEAPRAVLASLRDFLAS